MKQKLLNSFKLRAFMLVATLCAVFTGQAWADDVYQLYSGEITEGDYLIVDGTAAMNTTISNDRAQFSTVTITEDEIINPDASLVWTIAHGTVQNCTDYYTLYNANGECFAASTGAKNKIQMASSEITGSHWTISGTSTYEFVNKQNSSNNVNANLRKNGDYGFACYSTSTGKALTLYKKVSSTPDPSLNKSDFVLTNAPVALSFDLYNNADAQTISYTSSSTGAVTVSTSDYVTTSVNESAKTITVTPVAVTPNAQTIIISQAADDTYAAGSQSFTVTIDDSTPLPTYTITLGDNNEELTEATNGAGVTLPTRDAIGDYAFAGWSTTNIETETTEIPTIIPAGAYQPSANITLFPVYTMTVGGSGTSNETISVTIKDYATANNWANGTAYQPLVMDENISVGGEVSGNNFKFYNSDNSWRFYTGGSFTITATNNATLSSVTLTFNGGTLNYGESTLQSGKPFDVSGSSAEISCTANARITAISVDYTISGGGTTYYWSAPVAAAVERPAIEVAENPFFFSTTATITCETDGATIKYSYDGETWSDYTAALTITESTTIYAKAFKGNDESNVATVTATKKLATPTVTIAADNITNTNVFEGTAAGSLSASVTYEDTAVEGATVTWSSNNGEVATINASTGEVTLVAAGSVTFTATYAGNSDYSEKTATYEMTVTNIDPNAPGSENNPYSVTEAIDATPASGTSANVYIHGIVSAFYKTSVMDDGKNYRYYISDDGTTTNQLLVYKGKGLNNVAFSNADDLQLGDEVVICGGLTIYNGTSEVAADNYIVSLTHKPSISLDPATAALFTYEEDGDLCDEQSFTVTGTNLTSDITVSVTGEFDLRPSDGGYGNSTLSLSSGDEFFVNMNYDLAKGNYEGTLTIASEGATTITIALTGTVTGYIAPAIAAAETAVNVNATENNGTISMTYTKIDMNNIDVEFYESDGTTTATYDWISASIDDDNNVAYTVEANTGEARTAYLKVFGTDSNGGDDYIYSELVTITQAEYVAPSTYTLASSITSGKHYIIVGVKDGTYKAMGGQNQNNRKAVEVAENDGTVTGDEEVCEFVIYGPDANGRYAIYDETLPGYLYAAGSGNNYLKTQESNNINGKWTISFGETLSIVADGSSNRNVMQYNSNSSSSLFSCYGSASQAAVNLYEKDNEATPTEIATISPAGFATFSSATALDFTDVTEVYAYIAKQNGDRIQFTRVKKVPAETGVLLRSAEGNAISVDVPVLTGAADDVTGNIFVPVLTEISKLASTEGENSNYILSKEGNNVGFYLANDKKVAAGRAYIQVPTAEGVKGFALDFDIETAINGIVNGQSLNGNCYNLSGQRVNRAQKGIFIVNGKKVVK